MEEFNYIYAKHLQNPDYLPDHTYELGATILGSNVKNIPLSEEVLHKMIFMFPTKYELLYHMGYIQLGHNMSKALMCFRMCLTNDPHNVDNVLDLTKALFDNNYVDYIHKLDREFNLFEKHKNHVRITILNGVICIKEHKITKALQIFERLIDIAENNAVEDEMKNLIYCNAAILYGKVAEPEKSIELTKKICYLKSVAAEKFIVTATTNRVLYYDYIYSDNKERFELAKTAANLYTISNTYDFRGRKQELATRKIRVGYVSSGFVFDVISNFIISILYNYDRTKYDVFLFVQRAYHDTQNAYKDAGVTIYDVQHMSTEDASNLVYKNKIDILIDLNGFTEVNRLDIFSRNPAPIQITYAGFPNSLGVSFMKYRITDGIADHADSTQIYSEKLLKMPRCFLLFHSIIQFKPVVHEKKDYVLFGSINKENKNSRNVLNAWKEIMERTRNTKILIKLSGFDNAEERRAFYKKHLEIEDDRLIIVEHCSNDEYVNLFAKIDILLDSFPYSGTTTTCNALYNSVPVVTMYHQNYHVHNVSASLLINSGFPELVTIDTKSYIEKAIDLSEHPEKIEWYKQHISTGFKHLMNPVMFMRDYENILQGLIQTDIV